MKTEIKSIEYLVTNYKNKGFEKNGSFKPIKQYPIPINKIKNEVYNNWVE
jgi:hypothetical protein